MPKAKINVLNSSEGVYRSRAYFLHIITPKFQFWGFCPQNLENHRSLIINNQL